MFWNRRRSKPSATVQEQLDKLVVEQKRLALDERVYRNQILHAAAQRDPVAAAQIAFGSKRGGANPIVSGQSLGDKVVQSLVERVLTERDDDPAQKIARLRRAALEDRALRRVMEADDDDGGPGEPDSLVRDAVLALVTAVGAGLVPLVSQYAPTVAARLQTAQNGSGEQPAVAAPQARAELASQDDDGELAALGPHNGATGIKPPGGNGIVSALDRLKVRMVLRQLETLSPEAFAAWAVQQPAAQPMLVDLADTPDEDLDELLAQAIDDDGMTEWRPALEWLRDHPSETRRIIDELRGLLEPGQPTATVPFEAPPSHAVGGL